MRFGVIVLFILSKSLNAACSCNGFINVACRPGGRAIKCGLVLNLLPLVCFFPGPFMLSLSIDRRSSACHACYVGEHSMTGYYPRNLRPTSPDESHPLLHRPSYRSFTGDPLSGLDLYHFVLGQAWLGLG